MITFRHPAVKKKFYSLEQTDLPPCNRRPEKMSFNILKPDKIPGHATRFIIDRSDPLHRRHASARFHNLSGVRVLFVRLKTTGKEQLDVAKFRDTQRAELRWSARHPLHAANQHNQFAKKFKLG